MPQTTESHFYITVMGCFVDYQYIEVMHSGAQILVAVSTFCTDVFTCTYSICMCRRVRGADRVTCSTPRWPRSPEDSCVWKVIATERKVMFLFPSHHFSLHTSAVVCYFVYCSLPSSAPVSEWTIDPLFCLADTQTCQQLTGYWNADTVLFIRLTRSTPEPHIANSWAKTHSVAITVGS